MRLWKSVGWRPHSTQLAVERGGLKNTVVALFTLKWVSGKLGLKNQSRGSQSRFLPKTVSRAVNSQYFDKNTSWMTLGRFGVQLFVPWFALHLIRF